ncbi:hypothetical protein MPTK1_7g17580 [Marchantia polymorpha subsp. ruderalis]|uniref:GRAM domain-containing protein n=2 Tax=Marchantia polymorpha TaxID=3197 RepID=A0A176WSL9_MARPO|nr:hypothetical protein AXG93_392s1190 [Marchantia polymorpha subsp. ruderalis]PTQ38497.1 hypothetical protein MARPO_0051s0096 [Marchantia polymorpha]BBN17871.1 hypothetical protein Mp_7g17580 [Marchantia polymorpha subsp. ruderalis]|eukprot:PTQ38497.1 hypothetical protein MARPO_0051s0096 [Marchantia polymorpha]
MDPMNNNSNQHAPPYPYQHQNSQQHSSEYSSYPQVNQQDANTRFGTPVMGAPANPSAHPDNQHAAIGGMQSQNSGLFRQPSGSFEAKQAQTQPVRTTSGTQPLGQAPQSPYVQSSTTGQKGTMDKIVEQVNQIGKKVEVVAGNVWGHLTTGSSVTDAAWGRVTAGTRILTEGGFEKVFKSTFPVDADETLKKTYACYLSTSTGPVAGTLYVSSKKFAFCSDRPLSYTPSPGQQAFSYYKVVVPLDRVQNVVPSVNQNKPAEKYIQVNTQDNYEFWFMGFVNYDKGVSNMQAAVRDRGTAPSTQTPGGPYQQPPSTPSPGGHQVYPPPPQGH